MHILARDKWLQKEDDGSSGNRPQCCAARAKQHYPLSPTSLSLHLTCLSMPEDNPSTVNFLTNWTINLVGLNNIMARHCPQHGCTCGPASNDANASLIQRDVFSLPFTDHPLFFLRKSAIIAAAIGTLLSTISMSGYHGPDDPFGFTVFALIISILYCLVDLISYARQKVRDPDSEPKWPSKRLVFGDLVLAGLLFILFWACIAFLTSWYYGETHLLEAYGALAALVCS